MLSRIKKISALLISCVVIFALSACGNREAEKRGDYLTGNKWETSSGMLLDLANDGSFKWFNNKSERNNNYYSGSFQVLVGEEAVSYLVENHEIPEESQRTIMNEYSVADENYYVLILNNKERIQDGENTLEEESEHTYYGFYVPESDYLELFNLNTMTTYEFMKM